MTEEPRPPSPPFTRETAAFKARLAEDIARIALACTRQSQWRNRAEFFTGRDAITALLTREWESELDYRPIKEARTGHANRITVFFAYAYHDRAGDRFRAHGGEN
jgi:nuclear transport factor 2 (NTF2) superfamily protein